MHVKFSWHGEDFRADMSMPIEIAIPLTSGADTQPNAYGAPLYEASPVKAGDFVGSLDAGAPVNFFNIALNPHGNGTHTECVGHILKGPYTIASCLKRSVFVAELISVTPEPTESGLVITREQLEAQLQHQAEAVIVRTLPNSEHKKRHRYTGTNPPYFTAEAMRHLSGRGCLHFLTDLPSVDPEVDGGALSAHHAFWNTGGPIRSASTITEMVYVAGNIPDGLYLLDLHTAALDLDVSPSRPMLYVMEKIA